MERFLFYLPNLMIILAVIATIIFFVEGKWGSALYWFCGALINFVATYVMPLGK